MTEDHEHDPTGGPEPFDVGDFLTGQGIDPADLTGGPNPLQPRPFDRVRFRRDQALATFTLRVPEVFAHARADHPGVVAWVRRYLADPADCPSLLLVGPTGTGKTHQLWGAIRAVVEGLAEQGRGLRWQVTTHPELNAAMRPGPDNRHVGALERLMGADLLGLDDLGAGKQTDWTGDSLYRLVDYRWSRRLPMIYSANEVGPPLVALVGDRVVSRLGDAMKVALVGGDRRWGRRSS